MDEIPLHEQILASLQELLSKNKITFQNEEEIRDLCELLTRCKFQAEEKREIVKGLTALIMMLHNIESKKFCATHLSQALSHFVGVKHIK